MLAFRAVPDVLLRIDVFRDDGFDPRLRRVEEVQPLSGTFAIGFWILMGLAARAACSAG